MLATFTAHGSSLQAIVPNPLVAGGERDDTSDAPTSGCPTYLAPLRVLVKHGGYPFLRVQRKTAQSTRSILDTQ